MSKYAALDARILKCIAGGANTFGGISGTTTSRRLQALRKAEKIVFIKGRWAIKQKVEI